MDPENYDDTIDVLGMLKGNLEKVSEHGANTTRTLKAMEEVMKDRSSGIIKTDLVSMMHKDEEMLNTYYEKDITEYHIKCVFECPTTPIYIKANPELLSSSLMSLLNNSLYAVKKKAKRKEFTPEIDVTLTKKNNMAQIVIRDNGIGIEDTIINKIFDPFFTTKTTGEASGVGLYLSREIIQTYGGDITVKSQKDEFTAFTITLPAITQ
jgi:signal transduction histidine kinase